MFSNRKLWYVLGFISVVGLLLLSFYIANRSSTPGTPSNSTSTSLTLVIPVSGGAIPVSNITQNPVQQVEDTVVFAKTSQYTIVYFQKEQTFSISIDSAPVQVARDAAESALLQKLGINKNQACSLTVSTYVPFSVDENLAGQDYGLSFCPSGKAF